MTKSVTAFLLLAAIGAILLLIFRSIGATIDEDGFLHEPFALVPIGFFLIGVGIVGAVVSLLRWILR